MIWTVCQSRDLDLTVVLSWDHLSISSSKLITAIKPCWSSMFQVFLFLPDLFFTILPAFEWNLTRCQLLLSVIWRRILFMFSFSVSFFWLGPVLLFYWWVIPCCSSWFESVCNRGILFEWKVRAANVFKLSKWFYFTVWTICGFGISTFSWIFIILGAATIGIKSWVCFS